jgi:O-antigen/teichoic acid export membrane protein
LPALPDVNGQLARPAATTGHFAGALLSKLVPPAVQLALLLALARLGSLEDVGRLALASATSFTCGGLAEFGFGTSLSVPRAYFGVELPPVRHTRRLRLGAALAGSLVYCLLWAFGLGNHDATFLILAPLPTLLALSYGYAGVMNAEGGLAAEGRVTVIEAVLSLAVAGALMVFADPLVAALTGLLAGRAVGTVLRGRIVRALPQSGVAHDRSALTAQTWFLVATTIVVVSGQIDVIAAGFGSAFATLGVFSPLMRTAYGLSLVAEALSWSLYGRAGSRPAQGSRVIGVPQQWSRTAPLLGVVCALGFMAVAPWAIPLILSRPVHDLLLPVLLFAGVVLTRFVTFSYSLAIIRAGRQRARVPPLLVMTCVLLVSGTAGALTGSITVLAAGRLVAEAIVAGGYAMVVRRDPAIRVSAAVGRAEALP